MNKASLYQRANIAQKRDAAQIISEYIHKIQWRPDGADKLLDVGCGSGNVLMEHMYPLLPPSFEAVVGTDISEKMVDYARSTYAHCKRTQFEVLDISTEKLPKHLHEQFDHVTSFYCLHWVKNQRKALENIYQILRRSGGDFLVAFLVDQSIYHMYRKLAKVSKWSMYMQDIDKFISPLNDIEHPSVEYGKLLQEVGFTDYNVEIRNLLYTYEGVGTFRDNLEAVCPFYERIPKAQREEFFNDIIDTVVSMNMREKNGNSSDYQFKIPYKLLVAYGRKSGHL